MKNIPLPDMDIISEIVLEAKKLNKEEQKSLLLQLRAKILLKKKRVPIVEKKATLTMAQIDSIKHKTRRTYAH